MTMTRCTRRSRLFALVAATAAIFGGRLGAAEAKPVELSPFKVGAQDALQVQNSTSLLNSYLLEQHGVGQLQDINGIAPNLFVSNSDSRGFGDVIALRGLANTIFFSAPSVALVVDDVPGGSVSSYSSSLLNLESLVVKAGPQGTSYGRNAPGGMIEIKTREPGSRQQGKITADYGSFKATNLQASVDGPLSDKTAYSLSLGYLNRDGYIDNTFLKRSADDRRSFVGRGYLYYNPDPSLRLRFGVLAENVNDGSTRLSSLLSPDPFKVSSDLAGGTDLNRQQYSFQLRKKLPIIGALIATTSWQKYDLDPAVTDLDLSPFPAATSRVSQLEKTWTQDIRLETERANDGGQARLGVFFMDSATDSNAVRSFIVPPSAFVPPNFVQTERTVYTIGGRDFAVYGNLEQPVLPNLTAEIGARAEYVTSDIDRSKVSSNSFGFPSPQDPRLQLSQKEDLLSVSGGLTQKVSDALSLHVRTSFANRPPGYSGFTANPALARFQSENSWASEAGLTFGTPKGRFGGSLLGFWNKVLHYQFERTVPNSTDYVVVSAPEVRSRGFEGKLMWQAADHVWWDFQAGYTDATFRQHRSATGRNVAGKNVPFIPESTLRTGVTVDFGSGFVGNASYGMVGKTYFDEAGTNATAQKNYGTYNAQLRYRYGQWTTTVYGLNLGDKNYYQFINPEIFAGSPGAPRRVGVQVSFEF